MIHSKKPFYFIRHGETDWNAQHIAMGQRNIPLNQQGISQAENALLSIKNIGIVSIAVSPLTRAIQTAQILNKHLNVPIKIINELKECSLGILEGKSTVNSEWLEWINNAPIKNAELFSSFAERVLIGFKKALDLPGPVLIISHRGVYRAMQKQMNFSYQDPLSNCVPICHEPTVYESHPWFVYPL